ncbi:MAG: VWA domain-containing protein [Deltaproteobacteria bacterium]|nr:VWA domain-containing protein [Deltaproteobacteria bacterium]
MLRPLFWIIVVALAGCGGTVKVESSEEVSSYAGSGAGVRACTPGQHRCAGNRLEVCNDTGDDFVPVFDCPVKCDAIAGNCGVCIPDKVRCFSPSSLAICSEDGLTEAEQPCPSHIPFCFEGECIECLETSACPPTPQKCTVPACDASHTCGKQPAPPGTPCAVNKECTASGSCCVVSSVVAKLWPLDLYFMLDRSGSMQDGAWESQALALKSFFAKPTSGDTSVGLRFFPLNDLCVAQDNECSGLNYTDPLVPWGLLPDHSNALIQALDTTFPEGCFTPTQEALHGVLMGAISRKLAYPKHVVVAVFVSDGGPCCQACPIEEPEGLGKIAAAALAEPPSIPTFAIFLDPKASKVMTSIAENGGTGEAYDGSGSSQDFEKALLEIQSQSIPCQLDTGTTVLNPNTASLEFTPTTGSSYPITKAVNANQCDTGGDWYFDDPVAPKQITLCPAFCELMKHDPGSQVTMYLECD